MKCPYCHSDEIRVVATRKFDSTVMRIRLCDQCHKSFQTYEEIQLLTPITLVIAKTSQNPHP